MSRPLPVLQHTTGLSRSAALMKALGPEADAVWKALAPDEAAKLKQEIESAGQTLPAHDAAQAYLTEMTIPAAKASHATSLSELRPDRVSEILRFISEESPQVTALVLSITPEETAAATVQALPKQTAIQALHRLMSLGDIHPSAITAIETAFASRLQDHGLCASSSGQDRLAEIMNRMDSAVAPSLMAGLDELEPGSSERIRALMFTFDDLANLDPASLQTLLANTDRALLIIALQDAKAMTADAFYKNMTQRAADVLRSEIETAGPYRRSEIEEARRDIAALARKLAKRGDLMSASGPDKDLIE